jgi:hypothetical protein
MEERRCDLPIMSDSQKCHSTGTILWHKALVLELNGEPKRTYGHLLYYKIFRGYTLGPQCLNYLKITGGLKLGTIMRCGATMCHSRCVNPSQILGSGPSPSFPPLPSIFPFFSFLSTPTVPFPFPSIPFRTASGGVTPGKIFKLTRYT